MNESEPQSNESAPDDPTLERFWIWWLRIIFGVELVVAAIRVIFTALGSGLIFRQIRENKAAALSMIDPDLFVPLTEGVLLPVAFGVCTFGCLTLHPRARRAMIIYCWCRILWIMGTYAYTAWQMG